MGTIRLTQSCCELSFYSTLLSIPYLVLTAILFLFISAASGNREWVRGVLYTGRPRVQRGYLGCKSLWRGSMLPMPRLEIMLWYEASYDFARFANSH